MSANALASLSIGCAESAHNSIGQCRAVIPCCLKASINEVVPVRGKPIPKILADGFVDLIELSGVSQAYPAMIGSCEKLRRGASGAAAVMSSKSIQSNRVARKHGAAAID